MKLSAKWSIDYRDEVQVLGFFYFLKKNIN